MKNTMLCMSTLGSSIILSNFRGIIRYIFFFQIIIYICMSRNGFYRAISIVRAIKCGMQYLDNPLKPVGYRIIHVIHYSSAAENHSKETVFTLTNVCIWLYLCNLHILTTGSECSSAVDYVFNHIFAVVALLVEVYGNYSSTYLAIGCLQVVGLMVLLSAMIVTIINKKRSTSKNELYQTACDPPWG